jgi:hypothetical protein
MGMRPHALVRLKITLQPFVRLKPRSVDLLCLPEMIFPGELTFVLIINA